MNEGLTKTKKNVDTKLKRIARVVDLIRNYYFFTYPTTMKKILAMAIVCLMSSLAIKAQFADAPVTIDNNIRVGISIVAPDGTTTDITPITFYGQKIGSGLGAAALTYGFSSAQNKNYYKGKHATNIANVGYKFIFRFGDVPDEYKTTLYMFGKEYNLRNFALVEFNSKKDRRELITAEINLWRGTKNGAEETDKVLFEVQLVEPNTYEVLVKKAEPGEYGFIFSDKGGGAYQSIFDFSVPETKKSRKKKERIEHQKDCIYYGTDD